MRRALCTPILGKDIMTKIAEFRDKLKELSREELLELIQTQDPELIKQIDRIEWVFRNKLRHLAWADGQPIRKRPLTNEELALLIDPPFIPDPDMRKMGMSIEQQRQVHISTDPVLWAKNFINEDDGSPSAPRVYQTLMLRHPQRRKVLRAGRRLGKTWTMAVKLLHYAFTHRNGRCLVLAPMKPHVGLIYEEVMRMAKNSPVIADSITRNVTSPQYEIQFTNGSSIRFFTTGMKSGGKSDVARGQEAHLIVLDELDYMGAEDLDAIYIMLQRTAEGQPDKELIGASTPTGRREKFWEWCVLGTKPDPKTGAPARFKEFWFPSYCNPMWDKEMEAEMRSEYQNEMTYRHEIEADWGEDIEGVYPRKYVDMAFQENWKYLAAPQSARSFFVMGVDWDKYGAGPNIVVLEVCAEDYEDERFANKLRVAYREEIPRNEYVLTQAVARVIELNNIFQPKHIYVDRGYGETQVELLHRYGVDHPDSMLKKRVKGISFSETFEMRDPATKQPTKKEAKPFMVDNLRQYLEVQEIMFPQDDEELYLQLISYVVVRTTMTGRPVFEASGSQLDHAHDALILACLAYTQNFGELHKMSYARRGRVISNEPFLNLFSLSENKEQRDYEVDIAKEVWGSVESAPIARKRTNLPRRRGSRSGPIRRSMF